MPKKSPNSDNLYLHVDGDSFFVACELAMHPELKGKPVIVGADRGIAVAMSEEAKAIGIGRGMPVFKIKKLFPEVVILPHHFELYEDIARRLHEILSSYFIEIEIYSIDECFALVQPFEVTYYRGEKNLMAKLKEEIERKLKVTYSLGLGRTKALSKLASKLKKPNGSVALLTKEDEIRALQSTSIQDIWGIGRQTIPELEKLGLRTAYDFAKYPSAKLASRFSRPILVLQKEFLGEPILEVESNVDPRDQKSIQSTATFRPSSRDYRIIRRELSENVENACAEARELHLLTNKISFFIKTSEFKYRFDEVKPEEFTSDPGQIMALIEPKLIKFLTRKELIRSTGVILHNLTRQEKIPLDLFGRQEKALKKIAIEEAADKIRKKFGRDSIKRAGSLGKNFPDSTGSSFKKRNKKDSY